MWVVNVERPSHLWRPENGAIGVVDLKGLPCRREQVIGWAVKDLHTPDVFSFTFGCLFENLWCNIKRQVLRLILASLEQTNFVQEL